MTLSQILRSIIKGLDMRLLRWWRLSEALLWPRRSERRLAAAIEWAGKLREAVSRQGATWTLEQRALVARECHRLLDLVAAEGLLRDVPRTSADRPATERETISRWAANAKGPSAPAVLMLDGIGRALSMKIGTLRGSTAGSAEAAPALGRRDVEAINPSPAAAEFSPSEAALLAGVTEKFYGSWAFRIAGGILVVAALFAVAGTVVIGSTTVDLKKELKLAAEGATKEIADLQNVTTADLQRRQSAAEKTFKELEDKLTKSTDTVAVRSLDLLRQQRAFEDKLKAGSEDLAAALERSKSEIGDKVKGFEIYVGQLTRTALDHATEAAKQEVSVHLEAIKLQISAPLAGIRDEDIPALRVDLGALSQAVAAERLTLDRIQPALAELSAIAAEAGRLTKVAGAIEAGEAAARRSAEGAASQASAASEAAKAAETSRRAVSETLAAVVTEAGQRQKMLGQIEARVATLTSGIEALEIASKPLGARLKAIETMLADIEGGRSTVDALNERLAIIEPQATSLARRTRAATEVLDNADPTVVRLVTAGETARRLDERLSALRKEIDELAARVNEARGIRLLPPEAGHPPEPALSAAEWRLVQSGLLALGHDPGAIDGVAGRRTRQAIQAFQAARREAVTGQLTPQQVEALRATAAGQQSSSLSETR